MEYKYLIMVDPGGNNNKFYKMIPDSGKSGFEVEYGRIGNTSSQKRFYQSSQFNSKYSEKINKGYVDQTHLHAELVNSKPITKDKKTYKKIDSIAINNFVKKLMSYAKGAISANYLVSDAAVTQKMVNEAQVIIDRLRIVSNKYDFNDYLVNLFSVIPRRMGKVADYMSQTVSDFNKIIQREQDLLDIMRTQVNINDIQDETDGEIADVTILEAMGIEITEISSKEEEHILKSLGRMSPQYVKAFRVENKKTREKFNEYREKIGKTKKVKELWHGSRNENWWNIIDTGLVLRPNAQINGKMFGMGLYFANKAAKSAGYISTRGSRWAGGNDNTGYLAIFDVLYGEPYKLDKNWNYSYGNLNYKGLQDLQAGADCFHAIGGSGTGLQNDEIIVYKEQQATIKYLVEMSS